MPSTQVVEGRGVDSVAGGGGGIVAGRGFVKRFAVTLRLRDEETVLRMANLSAV